MSWNNAAEYAKFKAEQEKLAAEYRSLGMTEEQIRAIYEFDRETYRSRRRNALHTCPMEPHARTLVFRLAMEQYADIGNQEYETERLRRLFAGFQCSPQPDAALLKSAVSTVVVAAESVKLRLKNGQIIERSDQQCKTMRQE